MTSETPGESGPPVAGRGQYTRGARELREEIKQLLLDRGLRPGDAVPSEASLMKILGVSRGSLREALKSLQALEIIETRHGSGMFVGHLSLTAMADGLAFHSLLGEAQDDLSTAADLADIRSILEIQLIRRVADSITDDELARLDEILTRMASAVSLGEDIDDLDREFHAELYVRLGNLLVLRVLDVFWHALSGVRSSLPNPFARPGEAVEKHRAIVDSLRERDADAAEAAMRVHFSRTRSWIRASVSQRTAQ